MSRQSAAHARPAVGSRASPKRLAFEVLGNLYDQALTGERCWVRHDDGRRHRLPVHSWLGGRHADEAFDTAIVDLCSGPTIDLGCGPGRLVSHLVRRGIPALGVDQSATAVGLARRSGAPALRRDVFDPLPGMGRWHNVLLADGNIGLGGDPKRLLYRVAELLRRGGHCIAEFDPDMSGMNIGMVRLESASTVGPWFRWASVGIDCAASLADQVGMELTAIHAMGRRVVATMASL